MRRLAQPIPSLIVNTIDRSVSVQGGRARTSARCFPSCIRLDAMLVAAGAAFVVVVVGAV